MREQNNYSNENKEMALRQERFKSLTSQQTKYNGFGQNDIILNDKSKVPNYLP